MGFSLTVPSALWLLAAVPLVWLARRFGRTNFNTRQQVLQAICRSLLLATLALALARPVISMGSSRMSVVYLVDVSHSVSSRAIADAAARIDAINAEVKPSHWRIVAFGADATVLETTGALRDLGALDPASPKSPVKRDGTDLERALRQARTELLPGHVPKIVLFSDGQATAGDVGDAIAGLVADGVPVSVVPLPARDVGDAWVDGVRWPAQLTPGGLTPAVVTIGAQKAGRALVELKADGRTLASKAVALEAGLTPVAMDVTFDTVGAQAVEASVAMPGDPLAANNRLAVEAFVRGRPRVLYLEGAAASAKYLQGALTGSGFDVTVRPSNALPSSSADLDAYDVVILSDVPRQSMPDASMLALGQWVEQGGGLLVAGGDAVYGEGSKSGPPGYRNTEIERLTPVTFERKDEPEVALIIVLDKSWSMAGSVMELCKAAAQAAIDALKDEHSVGVVTFNDGLNWDVTLRNVGKNRDAIRKAVAAIEPSGHTLIFPAIEQAFLALKDARARAKHVVLLSDGRSYPDDYEGLVTKMVAAKMTVSAIAVGPAADVELLTNIAKWGKGRSYIVADAKEVPQIFVKEAKEATTPSFDEKTLKPVVKAKGFLEGVDLSKAPALRGRTAVVTKDTAMELLTTEDGDPLLAFWPIGLGRSAVFASDVKDRWASDWLKWRGYAPFFSAIVHAIERQRPLPMALHVVSGPVREGARPLTVTVEARDARGQYRDNLHPMVSVKAGDGNSAQVPARQVGPGRYEARVVADAKQALTVSVPGSSGGAETRLILPDAAAEYRFRPPDLALLGSIAQATGGAVSPDAGVLRQSMSSARAARRALWPWLVALALVFWLADILLRRVRVFETETDPVPAAQPARAGLQ
jgi:Ca-activated chloride channel family protein